MTQKYRARCDHMDCPFYVSAVEKGIVENAAEEHEEVTDHEELIGRSWDDE